ncbi:MAG: ribosome maturation factor RimM [Pseudomonadota bacterium]
MKKNQILPPDDLIVMGRLNRPYGVRGWLKVEVYTEYLDSLLDFSSWWIQKPSSPGIKQGEWILVPVEEGKVYQEGLVVKLEGLSTPEEARLWGRSSVAISRADFPREDEEADIYWIDLIGLTVETVGGEVLGVVDSLLETGAHDVLCVHGKRGEQLIPYTEPFLKQVDTQAKRIIVDWEWVD